MCPLEVGGPPARGAAGGGRAARKWCRWRWTGRPQVVPLEVDGPPARGAAGGGRAARKGCRWRWTGRPQGVPLEVDGPPARDFIGKRAGRDLRDLRDLRDVAGARLHAMPFACAKQCCRAMILAGAKQMLSRHAICQCKARKPIPCAKHHPRHNPGGLGGPGGPGPGTCQAQRASRLPGLRACAFQPPASRLPSLRACAFQPPASRLPGLRACAFQPPASRLPSHRPMHLSGAAGFAQGMPPS